ncbi:MAG: NeuD/PglB/VioB family sugar acetyltransferase [Flavobacterium sp.]|uniref:NeuD/PglB/VioB family sugar acetyltransferase n=1 Tax=Flavobacterium sp. TaxID=239 RepID=UPI003267AB1B
MEDTQYSSSQETIIIGAGGLAREIENWINLNPDSKSKFKIKGFYLNGIIVAENSELKSLIVDRIDFSKVSNDNFFIVGIADCNFKENLWKDAQEYNIKFASYFHNTALIGARTTLGIGVVVLPYSIISCDANIGNLVFVNNGSQIGHDVFVGDCTSIMANVDIGGGAHIGKNVFIGSNAVILPGVKIPDNTVIGAGSVVIRSIKQSGSYFGNPAKKIF